MKYYTQEDYDYIVKNLDKSIEDIASGLGRSKNSVASYMQRKKICKRSDIWTKDEIDYLKENYSKKSIQEIMKFLGRSNQSIKVKASRLGLKSSFFWTEEDKKFVIENYKKLQHKEMAKILGKTESEVRSFCVNNKLSKRWTKEEIKYLEERYGNTKLKQMSKYLCRSVNAIQSKANLSKIGCYKSNMVDMTAQDVSNIIGIQRKTISKWCSTGLIKAKKKNNYWHIKEKNLIDFMEKNPKKWNVLKCDRSFFQKYDFFEKKYHDENEKIRKERWSVCEKEA